MKTGLFVSIAAALTLMISLPTGANAVGPGKQCGTIVGIQCDAGLFCQNKPGQCNVADAAGTCVRVPKICPKLFSARSAAAMARPTQRLRAAERRRFPRRITGSASPTRRDGKGVARAD